MPEEKKIVLSDAFRLEGWKNFFEEAPFRGLVLDTHPYLAMVKYGCGKERPLKYTRMSCKDIGKAQENLPVIVGE